MYINQGSSSRNLKYWHDIGIGQSAHIEAWGHNVNMVLSYSFVSDLGNLFLVAAVGTGIVIYDFENEKVNDFDLFFSSTLCIHLWYRPL